MPETRIKLSTTVMVLAFAILIGFAFLFYNMYVLAETGQAQLWERRMALYGTVEALAFTAAGYLFGKEVHREQAAKAEARANTKATEAENAKTDAAEAKAKGRNLKQLIDTKRKSTSTAGGDAFESAREAAGDAIHRRHLAEIADFAERLFPSVEQK
jgi:hypothetical protein